MLISSFSFELLKIFIKVAQTKNISKAAQELYISQPAVSQSIKKLESELDGILFYRSNKGLKLTEEGESFYQYVSNAISLIEDGVQNFQNYKEFKSGTVNIGIPSSLTRLTLTNALSQFHNDYPNIKFNIVNDISSNLMKDLSIGKLDFIIINDNGEQFEDYNYKVIKKLKHKFVYNAKYFNIPKDIDFSQLLKYPLILQNKKSNTRKMLDNYLLNNQLIALPEIEVVSQDLVKFFSEIGLGIGYCIEDFIDKKILNVVELKTHLPESNVILLTNKNNNISFAGKRFLEYLLK